MFKFHGIGMYTFKIMNKIRNLNLWLSFWCWCHNMKFLLTWLGILDNPLVQVALNRNLYFQNYTKNSKLNLRSSFLRRRRPPPEKRRLCLAFAMQARQNYRRTYKIATPAKSEQTKARCDQGRLIASRGTGRGSNWASARTQDAFRVYWYLQSPKAYKKAKKPSPWASREVQVQVHLFKTTHNMI